MAVRTQDILFRAGGATLKRLQTLVSAGAGRSEVAHTFTRADATTCATLFDSVAIRKAVANALRLDWPSGLVDASGAAIGGFLSEGGRTNTFLQSQALATTWVPNLLTPTNNSAAAPDGATTATLLVPTAVSSSSHRVSQTFTITANENVSFSMKLKASGYTSVRVQILDAATSSHGFTLDFDASTGLFGTNFGVGTGSLLGTSKATVANGYYHFSGAGTIGGGVTAAQVFIKVFDNITNANNSTAFTGDTVSGVLAWGAQLERAASAPSSYIPTTTGTVTRAVDSLTIPFNFGPLPEMTVLARLARPAYADNTGALGISPGIFSFGAGAAPRIGAYFDPAARNIIGVIDTATTDATQTAAIPAGNPTVSFQFKNLTTGGQVAIDTGSGLSAFSSAATAFSAFSSQTLRIGRYDDELYGVIGDLIVARGLQTRADMIAIP